MSEMETYLLFYPQARERKNRYKAISGRIRRAYDIPKEVLSDSLLLAVITKTLSDYRLINRIQQMKPEFRGEDYKKNKKILEKEARLKLGYNG